MSKIDQVFLFFEVNDYTVYVIRSEEKFIYTGFTEDLENRLKEHNNRSLSFWTKRGKNWKVVHREEFESRGEAMKREKWLKTGVGREYLKKLGIQVVDLIPT